MPDNDYCKDASDTQLFPGDDARGRMEIPETLRIGPYNYAVQFSEKVIGDHNEALYGHIIFESQLVKIQSGLSPERTAAILLHEAIHGIDEYMGIGLNEEQTKRLATGLLAFLRDNHLLRTELQPQTKTV